MPGELLGLAERIGVAQLRTLCAVVDFGSYAAAARALQLSVPALWARIRLLEAAYQSTLFRKRGRRVVPTDDALRLCEAVRPLVAGLESSFELVGPASRQQRRTITLVTGMRMALEELGPAVARFCRRRPEVTLCWRHADNPTAQEMLADGRADLAVMLEPTAGQLHRRVATQLAYQIEYLAVMPPDHPATRSRHLRWATLVEHPLVVGHPGTFVRAALDQALRQRGLADKLPLRIETDNSAVTIACVRAGLGIGIIAGREDGPLLQGLCCRSLRRTLGTARIVVAWQRGAILPEVLQELKAAICAV